MLINIPQRKSRLINVINAPSTQFSAYLLHRRSRVQLFRPSSASNLISRRVGFNTKSLLFPRALQSPLDRDVTLIFKYQIVKGPTSNHHLPGFEALHPPFRNHSMFESIIAREQKNGAME